METALTFLLGHDAGYDVKFVSHSTGPRVECVVEVQGVRFTGRGYRAGEAFVAAMHLLGRLDRDVANTALYHCGYAS